MSPWKQVVPDMTPEEIITRRYCELTGLPFSDPVTRASTYSAGQMYWAWFRACMEEWEEKRRFCYTDYSGGLSAALGDTKTPSPPTLKRADSATDVLVLSVKGLKDWEFYSRTESTLANNVYRYVTQSYLNGREDGR